MEAWQMYRADPRDRRIAELEVERDALSNGQETLRLQTARIRRELTNVVALARRVRCERDEALAKVAELEAIISRIAHADMTACPLCGADTRPQFDCKNCEVPHAGKECYREGQHFSNCPLAQFDAVDSPSAGEGEEE